MQRYQWLMEPVHSLSSHRYCHIAGFHRQRLHDIVVALLPVQNPSSLWRFLSGSCVAHLSVAFRIQ